MYNQENINKSIELIDSMIKVMIQQAKEIEQPYGKIVERSAEIDRICENIKNLENQIIETNTNISRLEVELNDNIYECQKNINDVKMITDYLSEYQEDIESTNDLYHISLSQIEKRTTI